MKPKNRKPDKKASRGKVVVRILALAWIVYGALLAENSAVGMVFVLLGLLLLLLSEFVMDAFGSLKDKPRIRIGWW